MAEGTLNLYEQALKEIDEKVKENDKLRDEIKELDRKIKEKDERESKIRNSAKEKNEEIFALRARKESLERIVADNNAALTDMKKTLVSLKGKLTRATKKHDVDLATIEELNKAIETAEAAVAKANEQSTNDYELLYQAFNVKVEYKDDGTRKVIDFAERVNTLREKQKSVFKKTKENAEKE